jgi:hemolysin III
MPLLSRKIKHPFCAWSHLVGMVLALVGTLFLIVMAVGKPLHIVAFSIYGACLIFLYCSSSLYHSLNVNERGERILRKLDHTGIFLLIAGTYVPVCMIALAPKFGITFLVLQGLFALTGILGTFLFKKFPDVLNVVLYLLMGWMAVPAVGYMVAHWPGYATGLLLAGGVTYTIGAIIFSLDKPHLVPGKFSAHDLWHIFVLGGSACHFFLMATFVARIA